MRIRFNSTAVALAITAIIVCAARMHAQQSDSRPVNERGPADAPVTIVEYCTYDSDPCARLNVVLNALLREHQDRVRFIFRCLPTGGPPRESLEDYAAFAAGTQGHFWEMHDLLLANRGRTTAADLVAMAKQLGLDTEKFRTDLTSQAIRDAAKRDSEIAATEGISDAPTVVINGRRFTNVSNARDLRPAIQEALGH